MKHLLKLVSLGILALMVVVLPGTTANAQVDIDPDALGSINITKYADPRDGSAVPGNGLPGNEPNGDTVEGVGFRIDRVPVMDPTSPAVELTVDQSEWWEEVQDMTEADAISIVGSSAATASGTTNASGDLSFSNLATGLYLVRETITPNGVIPGAPFLVTLPTTDPVDLDNWLYSVSVFPKNDVLSAEKSVEDSAIATLGEEFSWTISSDIPFVELQSPTNPGGVPAADAISQYTVIDNLDPKLDFVSVSSVSLTGTTQTLVASDYSVNSAPGDPDGTEVTVDFTASGLEKLALAVDENAASKVEIEITTSANETGVISNMANVDLGDYEIASNEIETRWGGFTVLKVSDETNNPLQGAEFQIFATEADARSLSNPLTVDGTTTFVTGADGTFTVSGLRYSDWINGGAPAGGLDSYWVAETKAPAGYELLVEPLQVNVTAATSAPGVDYTLTNVEKNGGFDYPDAGTTGGKIFYGIAGLLLVLAFAAALRFRNRTSK